MPRLRYNLDEIEEFPSVPEGRYQAQLTGCTSGKSRSGNPMLTWSWRILTGEARGVPMKSWTSLQDHALIGLKEHLLALGYKGKVDVNTDRLLGRKVIIIVGPRTGTNRNGEEQEFDSIQALLPMKRRAADAELDDEFDEDTESTSSNESNESNEEEDWDDDDFPF